ncbi:MAG: hypothetical protein IPP66_04300 [Anaerolineales bacterium]|nr:hypothetical protein [Anaerolineales bacterium]
MSPEIISALIGLVGVILGAIPTYLFMRQKGLAEIEKTKAETEKIKAESEQIRKSIVAEKGTASEKTRILFIAASPSNLSHIRFDKEIRGMKEGIQKSGNRDAFELEQVWAAQWNDLQNYLLKFTPDILHISCHATDNDKDGARLIFEDEKGLDYRVSSESLNNLLSLFNDKLRMVVLNTVYSDEICKLLANNIDFAIGVHGLLGDDEANKFASAFYEAIAENKDVRTAFEYGRARIESGNDRSDYRLLTMKKPKETFSFLKTKS